ncbi:MAG: hypothetical protein KBS74_02025 [Clostridiales bacterium]|nr:hypothetical protein [Candidatus Cacconaster stercorequi]
MDIKNKMEEIVNKIKSDDGLAKKFAKEPVKTLEDLLGVDLPDEQMKQMIEKIKDKVDFEEIEGKIKNKVDFDEIGDKLEDIGGKVKDKVGDLLGKK